MTETMLIRPRAFATNAMDVESVQNGLAEDITGRNHKRDQKKKAPRGEGAKCIMRDYEGDCGDLT